MLLKIFAIISAALCCAAADPINAAITSTRTVEIKSVSLPQDPILPQVVEVAALELPIQIIYNSRSSPVLVHQNHVPGAPGQVETTSSQEEPLVVINQVTRPVVQELRELITPYRRVVQEVAPVVETVNTLLSKGEAPVSAVQVASVAAAAESAAAPPVVVADVEPTKIDTIIASASSPNAVVNSVPYITLEEFLENLRKQAPIAPVYTPLSSKLVVTNSTRK